MSTAAGSLAHILHELSDAAGSAQQKWATVLDAKVGTTEFAVRHAVVMDMFHLTAQAVRAQPESRASQYRWSRLEPIWHALVAPEIAWSRGDMLLPLDSHVLGDVDLIAENLADVEGEDAPSEIALEDLRRQANEWLDTVKADNGLSRGLRATLTEHLTTLIWCLDNAERFGSGLVIPAADRASGVIARAITSSSSPRTWAQRAGAFFAAVALVAGQADVALTAIEHDVDMVKQLLPGDAHLDGDAHNEKDTSR